jgi:deoxyribonuclease IV
MLLGAHVSIAGGLDQALFHAKELGVNAIQTFASPPRSIRGVRMPEQSVIDRYLAEKASSKVVYHVFHGLYLINLAHTDSDYVDVCVQALTTYQTLAGNINGAGTCFHIGSHKGIGFDAVLPQVAEAVGQVLTHSPLEVELIMEMTAGQKGTIGVTFEEMARIFEAVEGTGVKTNRLKIGWDTQHLFASGYEIHTEDGLENTLARFEKLCGLDTLALIHLNDSAVAFDSHRDRHANLGAGFIGDTALARLVTHDRLTHIPFILEVPGIEKRGPGKADVAQLQTYAAAA